MNCLHLLICPICNTGFARVGQALECANSHTFDISKEGYSNLLLKKPSSVSGDTKEMLVARRDFLERGYYRPLSDTINELVSTYLRKEEQEGDELSYINILDAGCGEGYYLGRLQQHLSRQLQHVQCCYAGLDISKEAIRMAAKRYKEATFVVANLKERIVVASNSMHILLNIFAPRNVDEFARVVTPGGIVLVVIPNSNHLLQLRAALSLLSIEENKEQHIVGQFSGTFELITSTSINYTVQLNKEEIARAIIMTPNYWHLSDETREIMGRIEEMETEVGFTCMILCKR